MKVLLDPAIDQQPERYRFTWAGKSDAVRALRAPSWSTLVPQPDQSVNFATTQHLFLEGDNLEVLKLLYKPYFGRVKMIYIDPPYNTGNDFIYPDNFADPASAYLEATGQADGDGNRLTTNAETSGRYHSAWLTMLYPRLFLARQLLRDDGVIFVSIDDHEVANLRILMNELFGEENFVASIIWQKVFSPKNSARLFSEDHDYVLVYARNVATYTINSLPRTAEADARYSNPGNDPRGPWSSSDLTARNYYSQGTWTATSRTGKKFPPPRGRYWTIDYLKFLDLDADNRIWWGGGGGNMPRLKRFLSEVKQGIVPQTLWKHEDVGHTQEAKKELLDHAAFQHTENVLDTVKPVRLIRRMLQIATTANAGDVVLDFFSGSASTAQAVVEQNHADSGDRRFICVQFPEPLPIREPNLRTIADIGKERIRRVIAKLQAEQAAKLDFAERAAPEDLGFRVFTLDPSNLLAWQPPSERTADAYLAQLEHYTVPLLPEWQPAAVLWEVIVKEGLGLASALEQIPGLSPNAVYRVVDADQDQSLLVCLDDTLHPATVAALRLGAADRFVCRDTALTDDLAANLALQCQLKTI